MGKALKIVSPAKVNLYLEILNKRADGYHTILTLFERISLCDEILLTEVEGNAIRVESDAKDIPLDSNNLAYKAAALVKEDLGISKGLVIRIKKHIPAGAGLGGGSSNAASTLLGLNRLWNLRLSRKKLFAYAARLGSDVAFFAANIPFAWGSSRGEKIKPFAGFDKKLWHILLVPKVNVSTKEVYQQFDKLTKKNIACASPREAPADFRGFNLAGILSNRLEEVTFKRYPKVRKLKEDLIAYGLKHALMSGSGGSVFGIVESRKEGLAIARIFEHRKDVRAFVVKTM